MRAFLDPSFKREFQIERPRDAETLPKSDVRRFAPKRLPRRVAQLATDAEGKPTMAAPARVVRPLRPAPMTKEVADASKRALWKSDVRSWMRYHNCSAASRDWELPRADEKVLLEWFDAIDVDRNGDVDADEIKALLHANGIGCSAARLETLFSAAGKNLNEGLNLHDFVRVMHHGGAAALFLKQFQPVKRITDGHAAAPSSTAALYRAHQAKGPRRRAAAGAPSHNSDAGFSSTGGVKGEGDPEVDEKPQATLAEVRSDGDLAVLTYRRQRVLNDVRDPTKRGAFISREAFLRKYTPGSLPAYKERWAARSAEVEASDPIYQLSDAESRIAADGCYFKQQIDLQREADEADERSLLEKERLGRELPRLAPAAGPSAAPIGGVKSKQLAPVTRLDASMRGSISLPAL